MPEKIQSKVISKLALGTVQFGMAYGVANSVGQVTSHAVAAILDRAAKAGIDTLDTAIAYGNSEACLGDIGVSDWKVITKLPALPESVSDVAAWANQQVADSMQRLRATQLDALLLHCPSDLMGKHGTVYCAALSVLKRRGLVRAIGVSVYAPAELDVLWQVFLPDLVQMPFNVLDRRLIHSGWLSRLSQAGVRIHTRSSFLQGLLLMPKDNRPGYFRPWASLLDRWQTWCADNRLTPTQAALNFVLAQEGIERVIIGVDSVAQLDEILLAASGLTAPFIFDSYTDDVSLLEPSRWKLP